MSGMFDGNFSSPIQENHNFICEHPVAQALGICSTTYLSFHAIYNKLKGYIKETFPGLPASVAEGYNILDLFNPPYPGEYDYYNQATKVWVKKKVSIFDAINLIKFYENVKRGNIQLNPEKPNQYQEEIDLKNISISVQKGIRFSFYASNVSWLGVDPRNDEIIVIMLYFKSALKANHQRSVANKGPLMMVDTPRTVTGMQYGFKQTNNHQAIGAANIATYFPAQPGGTDNVENVVAGQLETVYNQNTGRFEAGNRVVLAKILNNDIPPAEIDKTPIKDKTKYTASDFYDPLGGNYNGQYSGGEAVILTCEGSNPAMLGPNFCDCKDGEKLEKVRIINRTNNTYTVGETVKLTSIDGFWCAEPYAGESKPKAPLFGEWSFAKLIANSDVYFKDNDYYTTGSKSASVKDYEVQARKKFYYNETYNLLKGDSAWMAEQVKLNGDYSVTEGIKNSSFTPAKRYYISTVYDQLHESAGGWSKASVIGRTNMALAERGTDVFFDQDCPFFWGPLFSNGYSSLQFNDTAIANGYIQGSGSSIETRDVAMTLQGAGLENHLPAEMVGNILDFRHILWNYEFLGSRAISGVLTNDRWKPTFYGSIPIGLNSIQFVPMTFEFAAHNDVWSKAQYLNSTANSARKVYEDIDKYFEDLYSLPPSNRNEYGYFGNMFERTEDRGKYIPSISVLDDDGLFFLGSCGLIYDKTKIAGGNQNTIAYDCYIKREPTSVPLGAPDYFNDSGDYLGANCVGIISAHNKVTKRGGGDINFSVSHVNIGLASNKQATGGGSLFSSFFDGMFLNMINTGAAARNIERAMWGSTTDNIDSFGTTALHVRIFDAWPEEQTVFDPRYFAVLHFNPGNLYSTDGDSSVDMETFNLAPGTEVGPDTEVPLSKNTIRRGQLLSAGGFKYKYRTMGLHPNFSSIPEGAAGTQFAAGDLIKCGIDDTVEILIQGVNEHGSIVRYNVKKSGYGYTQEAFVTPDSVNSVPIVPVILKSPREGGASATIWFNSLIVVEEDRVDEPPKEHTTGPTRLTYSSNGAGYINKTKDTTVNLGSNSTGQYDFYFHFHNDITHTAMLEHGGSQVVGFGQYLDMTIT